jgi:hypothetical protein
MVPGKFFGFEEDGGKQHEDDQRNGFLYGFQLDQVEWAAVAFKAGKRFAGTMENMYSKNASPQLIRIIETMPKFFSPCYKSLKREVPVPGKRHKGV